MIQCWGAIHWSEGYSFRVRAREIPVHRIRPYRVNREVVLRGFQNRRLVPVQNARRRGAGAGTRFLGRGVCTEICARPFLPLCGRVLALVLGCGGRNDRRVVVVIIIVVVTGAVAAPIISAVHSECWNITQPNVTCIILGTRDRGGGATGDGSWR